MLKSSTGIMYVTFVKSAWPWSSKKLYVCDEKLMFIYLKVQLHCASVSLFLLVFYSLDSKSPKDLSECINYI